MDDDGGEEVEACHAEVLTFGGAVADFTLATDAEGVFQGVVGPIGRFLRRTTLRKNEA